MNQTIEGIELNPVVSSQICAIGHDEKSSLLIQFKDREGNPGSIYRYENFSFKHYLTFREAESIGSYFYRHIKSAPHTYPFKKLQ
jgi:hypothetical protein